MKLVEAAWKRYAVVIPRQAPEVQRVECRRAFYAGAGAILAALADVVSPGDEATEGDLAVMDAVQAELDQYVDDLQAGRA